MSFDQGYEWEKEPDQEQTGTEPGSTGPEPDVSAYPVPVENGPEDGTPGGYPPGENSMAKASVICWGISFLGIFCCGIGGIVLGCLAVLFGLLSRTGEKFESKAVAGMAMGAAAAAISVGVLAVLAVIGATDLFMGGY